MYESHSDNNDLFNPEFKSILAEYINIDLARVKKIPESIKNHFIRFLKVHNDKVVKFKINNINYGFLKKNKNKIFVFFIYKNSNEITGYVASEMSEKRIINFIRFLESF